ncbi:hypothetical protein AVEN_101113-1 [Araneus ventricosus]|uniref:Uncharacterized protein n=1 Tax=Araneus ventricosus TaxID=182803 RepID=A0A4Y2XAF7_ARAVE|nr:hypothetical protein AVEN_101113-1 [Araneus ventricosus]
MTGGCLFQTAADVKAHRQLQRVETALLHFLPATGGVFRAEHVRRCGGGELPPVQGRAGEGGEGTPGR